LGDPKRMLERNGLFLTDRIRSFTLQSSAADTLLNSMFSWIGQCIENSSRTGRARARMRAYPAEVVAEARAQAARCVRVERLPSHMQAIMDRRQRCDSRFRAHRRTLHSALALPLARGTLSPTAMSPTGARAL
jgi:hypothetical protein